MGGLLLFAAAGGVESERAGPGARLGLLFLAYRDAEGAVGQGACQYDPFQREVSNSVYYQRGPRWRSDGRAAVVPFDGETMFLRFVGGAVRRVAMAALYPRCKDGLGLTQSWPWFTWGPGQGISYQDGGQVRRLSLETGRIADFARAPAGLSEPAGVDADPRGTRLAASWLRPGTPKPDTGLTPGRGSVYLLGRAGDRRALGDGVEPRFSPDGTRLVVLVHPGGVRPPEAVRIDLPSGRRTLVARGVLAADFSGAARVALLLTSGSLVETDLAGRNRRELAPPHALHRALGNAPPGPLRLLGATMDW
jgi:hypothetical protein